MLLENGTSKCKLNARLPTNLPFVKTHTIQKQTQNANLMATKVGRVNWEYEGLEMYIHT